MLGKDIKKLIMEEFTQSCQPVGIDLNQEFTEEDYFEYRKSASDITGLPMKRSFDNHGNKALFRN